jgi:hypothetical protein
VVLRSWVILKNSDIVSADLAAAAVSGGQRLGSSTIPSWYDTSWDSFIVHQQQAKGVVVGFFSCEPQPILFFYFCSPRARWVLGGVVYTVVPFYNRVRHLEGT